MNVKQMTSNGYKWIYDEDGAHFFMKEVKEGYRTTGYLEMRCLPSDLSNGNFEFMCEHGLTNTNKK